MMYGKQNEKLQHHMRDSLKFRTISVLASSQVTSRGESKLGDVSTSLSPLHKRGKPLDVRRLECSARTREEVRQSIGSVKKPGASVRNSVTALERKPPGAPLNNTATNFYPARYASRRVSPAGRRPHGAPRELQGAGDDQLVGATELKLLVQGPTDPEAITRKHNLAA